jgi:hypothetical protein
MNEVAKYIDVIKQYVEYVETRNSISNNEFEIGFHVITNVFQLNICRTNIENAYLKSQQSFCIYLEYLEQRLQKDVSEILNINDVVMFVYNKTIEPFSDETPTTTSIKKIYNITRFIYIVLWFENTNIKKKNVCFILEKITEVYLKEESIFIEIEKKQQNEPNMSNDTYLDFLSKIEHK